MTITWLGHAAVLLRGTRMILIDPFLVDNPSASVGVDGFPRIDLVLVTHDHYDHIGQAIEIAQKYHAPLVAIHEVATSDEVIRSKVIAVGMNIGGKYEHEGVTIGMTQALHSAKSGSPCGFVVTMDEQSVYHAGDTALFSDMVLIPKIFGSLKVAMIPIGGHYVMDVKQAVEAVKLLEPERVIPIHYNTWPVIAAKPEELQMACKEGQVEILKPGESMFCG